MSAQLKQFQFIEYWIYFFYKLKLFPYSYHCSVIAIVIIVTFQVWIFCCCYFDTDFVVVPQCFTDWAAFCQSNLATLVPALKGFIILCKGLIVFFHKGNFCWSQKPNPMIQIFRVQMIIFALKMHLNVWTYPMVLKICEVGVVRWAGGQAIVVLAMALIGFPGNDGPTGCVRELQRIHDLYNKYLLPISSDNGSCKITVRIVCHCNGCKKRFAARWYISLAQL